MLASAACSEAEQEVEPAAPVTFARVSANDVAHGERIAAVLGCSGCHESNLQGRDWSDEMGVLWTANLTRSAEKHSDAEMVAMITTGRKPGRELHGMPSHIFTKLDPSDLAAILAFVRSKPVGGDVHPEPTFGPELRKMMADGTYKSSAQEVAGQGEAWPADAGPAHALGRYIVRATCAECHGLDLKGGKPPFPGDKERPDLTLMVPAYDPADFLKLLHTGKAAGDREVSLMSEVSRNRFAHLTDEEVEAVRSYIVAVSETAN
ncbi:c-type cytochrome [Qipengyuania soli]|uniref:C-type cytochrome n=1 Tax=Qipengyuania soli TaxID=2782568 RepID=A0A7S8F6K5_9SPHN|nr:cytochrome c [Qipengyuania soli]QPD00200.1 c-type cytochrome [Qipengyuania soli]